MTGTLAYILARKAAASAVSGIKQITFENNQIIFHLNDGGQASMPIPQPEDGVSIIKVEINKDNHLICTMSDGTVLDAGKIPKGQGGGLATAASLNDLPRPGDENTLYLALDTGILYYWNVTTKDYSATTGNSSIEDASLATKDDIDKMFSNLPDIDPDDGDIYATKDDIDKLFPGLSDTIPDGGYRFATKADIDKLFS